MTQGGRFGGWAFYLDKDKPAYSYNLGGIERYHVKSDAAVPVGKHRVELHFDYQDGGFGKGGIATLTVDGKKVAKGAIARTLGYRISLDETFDIGLDTGTPVSENYAVPFGFTGKLEKLTVRLEK